MLNHFPGQPEIGRLGGEAKARAVGIARALSGARNEQASPILREGSP